MFQVVGDGSFTQCIVDMARRLESPVYAYLYDYRNEISADNKLSGSCKKYLGCGHGDELTRLFKSGSRAENATDLEVSKLMVDVWCKFAVSKQVQYYCVVKRTDERVGTRKNMRRKKKKKTLR